VKVAIAKEHVVCAGCGADDAVPVATGREHEYESTTSDEFTFVQCRRCALVYLDPRPAESELGTIYPADYYAYQLVERRAATRGGSPSLLGRYMRGRAVARLRPYVDRLRAAGPPPYRILDVGCGDGSTLDLWQEAFAGDAQTHGIEMDPRAAAIAAERGHLVTSSRIEDASLAPGSFDLVYASHVIEHVPDPAGFLATIHRALSERGIVVIDTPNFDTLDRRIFGRRHWGAYHFPRHFFIFDAKTFGGFAARASFEVVETRYFPSAVMWVWTFHSMLAERSRGLADRLFPPVDVFLSGSPWNVALMSAFTTLDLALIAGTGRSSNLRLLLQKQR
jgi:2-polyprenyl-3-methyl-5-hydroxy-6-metoxy-1,4-benzoquinol methylase